MNGKTINGYTIQSKLGVGGMAEVWLAENKIGKKAAVKLLLPRLCEDEGIKARFFTEAKVMVELNHPNIRQVYDYGDIDGRPTIIMEYLEGDDLKAMMKRGRRFSEEELERWWNQIADALNYTHQKGIVHRDIKPSNIFIDTNGDVKLLDFGIAKVADVSSGTMTGSTLGTRIYMSPEQVKDPKRVGAASDVYSLAVSFVHLLTGKAPYDSTTSSDFDIQVSIVSKPVDLNPLPEMWRDFLEPYLEKDPDQRPALRPFEVVEDVVVPRAPDEDEGTVIAGAQPKPEEPERAHLTSKQPDSNKSKKSLWIGLGLAAAAVVTLILLMKPKEEVGANDPSELTSVDDMETLMPLSMFPTTDDDLSVAVIDFGHQVDISYDGKVIQSFTAKDEYDELVTLYDEEMPADFVHFLDANYDGYTDIYVGYNESRTSNALFLWNAKEQKFHLVGGGQNFMLYIPHKKVVRGGSNSSWEFVIFLSHWNGDKLVDDEGLTIITEPDEYESYGVEHRYTLKDAQGKVLHSVESWESLPEMWRLIVNEYGYK